MKVTLFAVGMVCVLALATHGQKKPEPRKFKSPPYFYKAETFLDLSEADRTIYTTGLMDAFYASALWGATDETAATLASCTKGMDTKQLAAILAKYVKDHPEEWQNQMSVEAYNALNAACPGVLKIIDR